MAGEAEDGTVVDEFSTKETFARVVVHMKRVYWDLEDRGRARVQWVRGNAAKMRQRMAARRAGGGGARFGSGADEGIMDPERADGGGEK